MCPWSGNGFPFSRIPFHVSGGRRSWLTEAPNREDGINHGGRESDRFREGRSSFELNSGRVRRRIADDAVRKSRGRSPTGNVGEACGLPGVGNANGAGRSEIAEPGLPEVAEDQLVHVIVSACASAEKRAGGEKKSGHWIHKQAFELHSFLRFSFDVPRAREVVYRLRHERSQLNFR